VKRYEAERDKLTDIDSISPSSESCWSPQLPAASTDHT